MIRPRKEFSRQMELRKKEKTFDKFLPVELYIIIFDYEADLMLELEQRPVFNCVLTQFKRLPRCLLHHPNLPLLQLCQRHAARALNMQQFSTLISA